MIYYQDDELVIRDMEEADGQAFVDEFTAQGCCLLPDEDEGTG